MSSAARRSPFPRGLSRSGVKLAKSRARSTGAKVASTRATTSTTSVTRNTPGSSPSSRSRPENCPFSTRVLARCASNWDRARCGIGAASSLLRETSLAHCLTGCSRAWILPLARYGFLEAALLIDGDASGKEKEEVEQEGQAVLEASRQATYEEGLSEASTPRKAPREEVGPEEAPPL